MSRPLAPGTSTWRKSSYSGNDGGNCIEVDDANPGTVRDSKDPDGPRLAFTARTWQTFIASVKAGHYPSV
ncbi:DUF397 domain-containing protein [Kitasatospora sp. YST-16]|uniref:DUF397 domain-containing protein n=1 Tax=Kitasatospora sp. YST-16 TaxID=2998080 RepID=UPI002284A61E|nr:DUF397 domain-containing protein [Kitasatospora sp. YST-16]WAL73444.1 DUF397 domain-containing protein [Kitasatospora sp. YST-16]WNW39495.1 DUF397 domain-containing protein [Streptomyces sp. Li-HN-5-13]